jgi:hypothetical protein
MTEKASLQWGFSGNWDLDPLSNRGFHLRPQPLDVTPEPDELQAFNPWEVWPGGALSLGQSGFPGKLWAGCAGDCASALSITSSKPSLEEISWKHAFGGWQWGKIGAIRLSRTEFIPPLDFSEPSQSPSAWTEHRWGSEWRPAKDFHVGVTESQLLRGEQQFHEWRLHTQGRWINPLRSESTHLLTRFRHSLGYAPSAWDSPTGEWAKKSSAPNAHAYRGDYQVEWKQKQPWGSAALGLRCRYSEGAPDTLFLCRERIQGRVGNLNNHYGVWEGVLNFWETRRPTSELTASRNGNPWNLGGDQISWQLKHRKNLLGWQTTGWIGGQPSWGQPTWRQPFGEPGISQRKWEWGFGGTYRFIQGGRFMLRAQGDPPWLGGSQKFYSAWTLPNGLLSKVTRNGDRKPHAETVSPSQLKPGQLQLQGYVARNPTRTSGPWSGALQIAWEWKSYPTPSPFQSPKRNKKKTSNSNCSEKETETFLQKSDGGIAASQNDSFKWETIPLDTLDAQNDHGLLEYPAFPCDE